MGCGDGGVPFFEEHGHTHPTSSGRPRAKGSSLNPKPSVEGGITEMLMNCQLWITLSQTQVLLNCGSSLRFFCVQGETNCRGRSRWSAIPAPSGLYEVIRGPRPPCSGPKGTSSNMQMVNIEQEPAVLDRWSARFCWPWEKRRSINRISEDPKFGLDSGRVGARGYVRQDGDRSRSEACQGGKASWRAENCQGPELDVLIAASKKAQKESQEFPLEAQIRAREGFV